MDRTSRLAHHPPLFGYAGLDELLGAEVLVKHENHQPVGASKVRGGVNLISQLSAEERKRGVMILSGGNASREQLLEALGASKR